jgi:glycosyltransferase involved in cell wall biosynthesis
VLRRHPERRAIYAIGIRAGLLAALAAAGTRRLIVWSVTDRLPPWPLRPLVRFIAILFPGQILCLSEYIASDLVRSSRALGARTFVVNPGVELERFSGRAVRPGAPVAGIVGHISRVKRTDLAIDIAKQVVDSEPAFKLRVIGSAQFHGDALGFERQLRARVENDPTVRGSVEFVGQQRDVASALEGCGLLLHCRPDEPFGMVVVEAMALGLPVVAPAAGGLLEIIEDGVSGLLFPPGDVRAAAACVRRLVADPGLAGRIGANARERVETRFTSARQLELTLELLSRRAAAATAEEHVD